MVDLDSYDLYAEANLKIEQITKFDLDFSSDRLFEFIALIKKHETLYPKIAEWVERKVLPGIEQGNRVVYIGYCNDLPIASAVLKVGKAAKFCHVHIDEEYQGQKLGEILFSLMTIKARHLANSIHFTLPQTLWEDRRNFFKSFGFTEAGKSERQYRSEIDELWSSVKFNVVWDHVLDKLLPIARSITPHDGNIFNGLLMSIHPKYVEKIKSGDKRVEIRKRFSPKWAGLKAAIYASSPAQELQGYVSISRVESGSPNYIWEKYYDQLGCTKSEFSQYVGASKKIFAIKFDNFESYISPLPLDLMSTLMKRELSPPQSYLTLEGSPEWAQVIALAELMHSRFRLYKSIYSEADVIPSVNKPKKPKVKSANRSGKQLSLNL